MCVKFQEEFPCSRNSLVRTHIYRMREKPGNSAPRPSSLFPPIVVYKIVNNSFGGRIERKNAIVVDQREVRALLANSANKIDEFADILAFKRRRQGREDDRLREPDRG